MVTLAASEAILPASQAARCHIPAGIPLPACSDHRDTIHSDTILGRCCVHTLEEYNVRVLLLYMLCLSACLWIWEGPH